MTRLQRLNFALPADELAPALIGRVLVRILPDGIRLAGRIVETEAYLGVVDRAAHSFGGRRTARTEPMFGRPGTSYVYFTYGMHHCMNVAASVVDDPQAVLIRALEPIEGMDRMRVNRMSAKRGKVTGETPVPPDRVEVVDTGGTPAPRGLVDRDLCSGPAKLCRALAIDRSLTGLDLTTSDQLWIEHPDGALPPIAPTAIVRTARVGVESAGVMWARRRLRWVVKDNPHVSKRPKT